MRTALVLLVCVAIVAVAQIPQTPTIDQFGSPLVITQMLGGMLMKANGFARYDQFLMKSIISSATPLPFAPGQVFNETTIHTDSEHWDLINGVCRNLGGRFRPMFGWVDFARFNGTDTIRGVEVNKWVLGVPSRATEMTLFATEHMPYRIVILTDVNTNNTGMTQVDFTEPARIPVGELATPPECADTARSYRCPNGAIEDRRFFVEHSVDDWHIATTTLYDATALASAMCLRLGTGTIDLDRILSKVVVKVNTSWGQLALCEDHICFGGSRDAVGHGAAFQLGGSRAQCETNEATGNWYSLPRRGICRDGQDDINRGPCTWQSPLVEKSIAKGCLVFEQDFLSACHADNMRLPFANATAALLQGFASNDPDEGGCRPMSPPEYQHEHAQDGIPHRGNGNNNQHQQQDQHRPTRSVEAHSLEDLVDAGLSYVRQMKLHT